MNQTIASFSLLLLGFTFVGCGQDEPKPTGGLDPIVDEYKVLELDGNPIPLFVANESQGSGIFCDRSLNASFSVDDDLVFSLFVDETLTNCSDGIERLVPPTNLRGTIEIIVPGSQYIMTVDNNSLDCSFDEDQKLVCRSGTEGDAVLVAQSLSLF